MIHSYGGATTLNGVERDDKQDNWRTGVALSMPLFGRHTLQLRATEGISARLGADFTTYVASYTYTF